jgi:hypothetical protein
MPNDRYPLVTEPLLSKVLVSTAGTASWATGRAPELSTEHFQGCLPLNQVAGTVVLKGHLFGPHRRPGSGWWVIHDESVCPSLLGISVTSSVRVGQGLSSLPGSRWGTGRATTAAETVTSNPELLAGMAHL